MPGQPVMRQARWLRKKAGHHRQGDLSNWNHRLFVGLLKAKKDNAQVILIVMDMPESSILLKQWFDMKIPAFHLVQSSLLPSSRDFGKRLKERESTA